MSAARRPSVLVRPPLGGTGTWAPSSREDLQPGDASPIQRLRHAIDAYCGSERDVGNAAARALAGEVAQTCIDIGAHRCAVGARGQREQLAWLEVRGARVVSSADDLPELLTWLSRGAGARRRNGAVVDVAREPVWAGSGWDLAIPIGVGDGPTWVAVLDVPPESPLRRDTGVLEAVAQMTSLGLERRADLARTDRRCRQAGDHAVVAERQRLAGDLHDTVGQALVGIRMLANAHHERLPPGAAAAPVLARIAEMAEAGKGELTEVARSLAFAPVARRGLVVSLRELVCSFAADSGIDVDLVVVGSPRRVPDAASRAFFRVAHEALANAWRHAHCRQVSVRFAFERDGLRLTVADDGVGIPDQQPRGFHLGLDGMRRATADLAGSLEIRPGDRRGTVVEAHAPVTSRR